MHGFASSKNVENISREKYVHVKIGHFEGSDSLSFLHDSFLRICFYKKGRIHPRENDPRQF